MLPEPFEPVLGDDLAALRAAQVSAAGGEQLGSHAGALGGGVHP